MCVCVCAHTKMHTTLIRREVGEKNEEPGESGFEEHISLSFKHIIGIVPKGKDKQLGGQHRECYLNECIYVLATRLYDKHAIRSIGVWKELLGINRGAWDDIDSDRS